MSNNEIPSVNSTDGDVDVSFFGLGTAASWIVFTVLIVAGVILLPVLVNMFL